MAPALVGVPCLCEGECLVVEPVPLRKELFELRVLDGLVLPFCVAGAKVLRKPVPDGPSSADGSGALNGSMSAAAA